MRRGFDRARLPIGFAILLVLLLLLTVVNIAAGSVTIPLSGVLDGLFDMKSPNRVIVMDVRMVRILPAILLGGALALSGFLLQTFFANPIAGPFILGISSGAKLVLSVTMIGFLSRGVAVGSVTLILASFAGAMLSMGFVLAISAKVKRMSMLIICGVMIGYICSAVTEFVIRFADDSNIVKLHDWAQGSFAGITWPNVLVMTVVILPALVCTFLLSKPIGAYQLGVCRTDQLCRRGGAASDAKAVQDRKADRDDPGVLFGRGGVLPAVRPDRANGVRAE